MMAHSPSPGPSIMASLGSANRRPSASPPLPQPPLSKRDKKRSQIENRVRETLSARHANRDSTLRAQLNALSRDTVYINRADLYGNQPLDDGPDDLMAEVASVAASGSVEPELTRVPLGKHAAQFVDKVNDAMEERDASLTNVHLRFKKQLDYFKMEYDFTLEVADAEEQALKEAARIRVINSVHSKKKALQKEKDALDSADSSTILNSSGFAITQPASPGGAHSNRKTRHGRHLRPDQDNLGSIEAGRRKRKAAADFDHESPGPGFKSLLGTNGSILDKGKSLVDHDPDTVVTLDHYFSARELASHYKQAYAAVAEVWAGKRPKAVNGFGAFTNGDTHETAKSDEDEAQEDFSNLMAPAMDRTGSHATRSTRNNQTDMTLPRDSYEGLRNPDRIYGLAVMDSLAVRSQKQSDKKDLEAPWTASLSTQEITEDRAYFEQVRADDSY